MCNLLLLNAIIRIRTRHISGVYDPTRHNIVTDLNNGFPGNSSVNKAQHATIEEAVTSIRPRRGAVEQRGYTTLL
jgi:hypothetical protein